MHIKHPAKRRNTRFIAVVVLFLWMIALGSGVANACLSGDAHRDAASYEHRPVPPSLAAISGSMVQDNLGEQVVHAAHGACADSAPSHATDCDVVTAYAPAPSAGQLVGNLADPEFEAAVVTDWQAFAAPGDRSSASHRHRGPDSEALPVYLRFLRLTL